MLVTGIVFTKLYKCQARAGCQHGKSSSLLLGGTASKMHLQCTQLHPCQKHPHIPGAGITKAVSLPLPLGSGFLSALIDLMIQILSMTSLTGLGGFCMDFTRVMSDGFRVLRAASAAARAGRASARSASHSSC